MRTVFVDADRLVRWTAGFGERHPGVAVIGHEDRVELLAPDGSRAVLYPAFAGRPGMPALPGLTALLTEPTAAEVAAAFVAAALDVRVIRALLIRRGGYACAVLTDDRVTASKVGSRYVQGRTAAGGWSQQRFARRREGQVHALIGSATEVAVRILMPASPQDGLITGGDKPLIDKVLADPRLKSLAGLRRGPHLEIGDPKFDLVKELPRTGRTIRISLEER